MWAVWVVPSTPLTLERADQEKPQVNSSSLHMSPIRSSLKISNLVLSVLLSTHVTAFSHSFRKVFSSKISKGTGQVGGPGGNALPDTSIVPKAS